MNAILPTLQTWIRDGKRFATATVTQTWGSSPRPVGSVMGIREDGLVCGSVSGGCVESAVIEAALSSLASGASRELYFDAISEDSVWDVGLSCGGRIQIWVEPDPSMKNPEVWDALATRITHDSPCVLITTYSPHSSRMWVPGTPDPFDGAVERAYRKRTSQECEIEGQRLFLNVFSPKARLVIVGSVHIAVPLVQMASILGFETIVTDPRSTFASNERFPATPDQMVVAWPEAAFDQIGLTSETYAVVLTHDPKIDDVALAILLRSPVAYIGALGSRVTQAKRRELLTGLGFTDEDLMRIHGPVGLNIGARSPEEIALSIMAEIVQVRRARSA